MVDPPELEPPPTEEEAACDVATPLLAVALEDWAAVEEDSTPEAEELPAREEERASDDAPAADELPPTLEDAAVEEAVPPLEELLLESPLVLVHPVRPNNPAAASQHTFFHAITLSSALRQET